MEKTSCISLVSVVLPTYNRAVYLREAIGSVLAQSYPHFELIVVDDGSTDATPQVVAEVNDPRVQYIRLPGNSGVSMARNVGICYAAGELVAFLDDDDAYYPEFLAHVAGTMAEAGPEVGFCWCGIRIFQGKLDDPCVVRERVVVIPSYPDRNQAFLNAWGRRLPATGYGLCIRKTCFATVGLFDAALRRGQDTDLVLRLIRAYDYRVIPEVLVKVRDHGKRDRSRLLVAKAFAVDRIYAKHAVRLRAYPQLRAGWLTYSGALYFRSGQRARARQRMLQALAIAPWRLRTWRLWAAHEWHYRNTVYMDA